MKSSLLALVAVLSTASVASASNTQPIFYSQLTNISVQGANESSGFRGSLSVNELDHTVTLSIETGPFCPANAECLVGATSLISTTLPITDVARNPNGDKVITAQKDMRMVDGDLQKLVIIDSANAGRLPGGPAIVGRYLAQGFNMSTRKLVQTRAQFSGSQLMQRLVMSR